MGSDLMANMRTTIRHPKFYEDITSYISDILAASNGYMNRQSIEMSCNNSLGNDSRPDESMPLNYLQKMKCFGVPFSF